MPRPGTRIERDLLGDLPVSADAFYGVQMARLTEAPLTEILDPAAMTGQRRPA